MEGRKANFKKTLSREESSKKRIEYSNKIRKENRDKAVVSKRSRHDEQDVTAHIFSPEEILQTLERLQKRDPTGLRELRRILSSDDPPLDDIIESPTQPLISVIHFLVSGDEVQQLDAAWCLTNVATGTPEQTAAVLPAAPYLIQHLSGSNIALVEQCAWALGNISGDCVEHRDILRANGVLKPLISILQRYAHSSPQHRTPQVLALARTAAFALSNQARGQNAHSEEFLQLGIAPTLAQVMNDREEMTDDAGAEASVSQEIVVESAWVLTYLTAQAGNAKTIADAGLIPILVRHLSSSHTALVIPVLRSIGNLIARSDAMTELFLDPGSPPLLPILESLLVSGHRAIKKEATYVISNIAGGPQHHVEKLCESPTILGKLVDTLNNSQFDIAREAAFALSNIGTSHKYMKALVAAGAVPGFLALVSSPNSETAHLALMFIEMVLGCHPDGPAIVENENGIEKLESLQFHENQALYTMANELIDRFYGEDYEDSDPPPSPPSDHTDYPAWRVQQR